MNQPPPPPAPNGFQAQLDLNLLGNFFAQIINQYPEGQRSKHVREALSRAFKAYEDYLGNYQFNARINIAEDDFEKLAQAYTMSIEKHEQEAAAKALNLGHGLFADVVDDEDYRERMKRAGLA